MHAPNYFHFFKNRELNELYASVALRAFALSMSGIFIAIYLYQLDYSFKNIFLFYGVFSLTHLLLTFPGAKMASKWGLKHSMLISMPFLVIFFILLYTLESFAWPLTLLAIILGASTSLFWVSYHIDFLKSSTKGKRGIEVGLSKIIASIFAVLGPLVGALILSFFGFKILFIFVSLILIASVLPLFMSKEIHEPVNFSLKGFFKSQKKRDLLSFFGNGLELRLGTVVWPLFIFLFILNEKYVYLGLISSLAFTSSLVFTFVSSKYSKVNMRRKVLKLGVIVNSIVWIFKSFVVTPLQVIITDIFYGAAESAIQIPFDSMNYDKGKKRNVVQMIVQREVYMHLGSVTLFVLLFFFSDHIVQFFRYVGPLSSLMRLFF